MENIINKELLSEVLNKKCSKGRIKDNAVWYENLDSTFPSKTEGFNIHELAHKCKEWAWDNGYEIEELCHNLIVHYLDVEQLEYLKKEFNTEDGLYIPYNPYRVFKACQWILDNKDR